jgi:hypothetical protein
MAEAGIEVPTFSTVTSAAVITRASVAAGSFVPGAGTDAAAATAMGTANNAAKHVCVKAGSPRHLLVVEILKFIEIASGHTHCSVGCTGKEALSFQAHSCLGGGYPCGSALESTK